MDPREPRSNALPASERRPFQLWIALFLLSWLPIFVGLAQQAHLALNSQFWHMLAEFSPKVVGLRLFWSIAIPMTAATLIAAAGVLLARPPYAALFAAGAFLWTILLNIGELFIVATINRIMVNAIATTIQLRSDEVAGPLQIGIALSFASLVYRTSCLIYLHQARQVRALFGPVTWRALHLWVRSIMEGEDWSGEAAA